MYAQQHSRGRGAEASQTLAAAAAAAAAVGDDDGSVVGAMMSPWCVLLSSGFVGDAEATASS
jgi:hypothetical protein